MILYLRIETVKNQLQTLLGTCTHTYLVHIGEYPPLSVYCQLKGPSNALC